MRKFWFQVLLSAAVWVSLCGIAAAKGPGSHGHGHDADHDEHHGDRDHDRDRDRDHHVAHHDRDHDRDHDRHASSRPPGWDKGKKTGWGNCNEPPGLAKKDGGCGSHTHHASTHHSTHHSTTVQGSTHHTGTYTGSPRTGTTDSTHTTTGGAGARGGQNPDTHVAPNKN